MKQGIVMEIKNRKAIILTKEGAFEKVPLKKGQHVEIGSEMIVPAKTIHLSLGTKRLAISIAAAVIFLLFFNQFWLTKQSDLAIAAYVGLDINPSLEIGVNKELNVVEVIPLNEDGKKIIGQIQGNYENQPLAQFIEQTIKLAQKDGYLDQNKDILLTTTMIEESAKDSIEKNLVSIKKEIEVKGLAVNTLKGDQTIRKEAKNAGLSTGKYMIYKNSKNTITLDEAKELSVTQIYEKVKPNNKNKNSDGEKNNRSKNDKNEDKRKDKGQNDDKKNGKVILKQENEEGKEKEKEKKKKKEYDKGDIDIEKEIEKEKEKKREKKAVDDQKEKIKENSKQSEQAFYNDNRENRNKKSDDDNDKKNKSDKERENKQKEKRD